MNNNVPQTISIRLVSKTVISKNLTSWKCKQWQVWLKPSILPVTTIKPCKFLHSIQGFHKHTKLAILALLPNVCSHLFTVSFFISNICLVLVHAKLDISGCNRIILQGCRPHWLSSFLMKQLK